jgi:hypothetical protein
MDDKKKVASILIMLTQIPHFSEWTELVRESEHDKVQAFLNENPEVFENQKVFRDGPIHPPQGNCPPLIICQFSLVDSSFP